MKKSYLKNEKGAIGTDTFISVLVITLFVGLIATLTYNIYLSTMSTKRNSQATAYIVEIFEYIDKQYYKDVTEQNLVNYIENKYNNAENADTNNEISDINIASARNVTGLENTSDTNEILTTPYKIEIAITPYDEKFDLVKTITVTIKYNLGTKEESITMTKVKAKENLITPNEPNMDNLVVNDNMKIYPIKFIDGAWYVTDTKKDTTWYNYENGYWATVFVSKDDYKEGEIISSTSLGDYYVWIPRYAYYNSDIKFLYEETEQYVNEEGNLESLPDEYTVVEGGWIKTFNITEEELYDEYKTLNKVIERLNK
ncbi:MAG: hypothetical protein IJN50_05320 [Clostridia bacterium]|nr:hypothetical protein [Clostridia bacterium]